MAVEIGDLIEEKLKILPADHRDRPFLEGLAATVRGYNLMSSSRAGKEPMRFEEKDSFLLEQYPSLALLFSYEPFNSKPGEDGKTYVRFWQNSDKSGRTIIDATAVSLFIKGSEEYDKSYDDIESRITKVHKWRKMWSQTNQDVVETETEKSGNKIYLSYDGLIEFLWYIHSEVEIADRPVHKLNNNVNVREVAARVHKDLTTRNTRIDADLTY